MTGGNVILATNAAGGRQALRKALEFEGHEVTETHTAAEALRRARAGGHDLMLMDSVIDGIAAHDLCRKMRPRSTLGIIVLGGEGTSAIDSLNAGADEYVRAPHIAAEIAARVRAILRRVMRRSRPQIVLHDRTVDLDSHKVHHRDGQASHLTPKEFLVLLQLTTHANQSRTHRSLAQTVWQRDGSGEVEFVRIVVNQLRRKLEPDPNNPRYILTERSVGYRFHMPESVSV